MIRRTLWGRACGTVVKQAFAQVRSSRDGARTSSENAVIWLFGASWRDNGLLSSVFVPRK